MKFALFAVGTLLALGSLGDPAFAQFGPCDGMMQQVCDAQRQQREDMNRLNEQSQQFFYHQQEMEQRQRMMQGQRW